MIDHREDCDACSPCSCVKHQLSCAQYAPHEPHPWFDGSRWDCPGIPPAWTHDNCNRSGWIGAGEPCPICERESRFGAGRGSDTEGAAARNSRPTLDVCTRCDGDGYVECWNHDQTDVVITLCPDCGPGPGYHDG